MGHSLSADVFWGFDLGTDDDIDVDDMPSWWEGDEEEGGGDWEEVLARRLGWVEVPFPTNAPAGLDDWRTPEEERNRLQRQFRATPEYQAWSASRDGLRDLVKSVGVEIDSYGYEFGGKVVRVKASAQTCYGAVRLNDLVVAPDWPEQIARFCELLELPVPAEGPGWHLCASWG